MPQSTPLTIPSPIEIKRLPWMRRLSLISPKLSHLLTVFSYGSLNLWAFIESHPAITSFCEYPGYVIIDDQQVFATFWVQGDGQQQFLVLEGDIQIEPENINSVPTFHDAAVHTVTQAWLASHQQWINNWHRINPYIVSNGRFVTPQILDATAVLFETPVTLFDAEHALRRIDQQLVRTAIFMLLHRGRITSADLTKKPLSGATLFYSNAARA
ncbi:hypothetical protein [Undibacterium umbellatum]|uniref:Crp/Fnr family transcriptional regulator n=1 Tax=Undibacterium umbellatum TaxID=2762300 RepID=A0ABR6ZHU1_9BURK|nr:hypothetical protein [Undibacterium umbellatum]MBC3910936.1 hypothetical protein [Undibacterium umbellatum]